MNVNRGHLDFYCFSLCKVFILIFLRMVKIQAETCSTHVNITNGIKNLFFVRLIMFSSFSNMFNKLYVVTSIKVTDY